MSTYKRAFLFNGTGTKPEKLFQAMTPQMLDKYRSYQHDEFERLGLSDNLAENPPMNRTAAEWLVSLICDRVVFEYYIEKGIIPDIGMGHSSGIVSISACFGSVSHSFAHDIIMMNRSTMRSLSESGEKQDMGIIIGMSITMQKNVKLIRMKSQWNVPFITVFAAENIKRFSYELLSLFDVRLGGGDYPAAMAKADNRYRLLCGSTAYYALLSGTSETALNFVTVLSADEGFSPAAESYIEKICRDKTASQLKVLAECLTAARRTGIDGVLSAESEGFYELMSQKTEDKADECS